MTQILVPSPLIYVRDKLGNEIFNAGNKTLKIENMGGSFTPTTNLKKYSEGYVRVYLPGQNEPTEFRLLGEYTKTEGRDSIIIVALQDTDGNIWFGTITKTQKESLGTKIDVFQFNKFQSSGEISFGGETYSYQIF